MAKIDNYTKRRACNGGFNRSWDAAPHVIVKFHRAQFRLLWA
jgi:hypothetical protein